MNSSDQKITRNVDVRAMAHGRVTIDWITARMFFTR
jgi:hypothetical protein